MCRLPWEIYFAKIASVVAERSTCLKRQNGAVLVDWDNKSIIATGYNGPAMGEPHCTVCARMDEPSGKNYDNCPAVHAEANAILFAARRGVSTKGSVMFCTFSPCKTCRLLMKNAGVDRVVWPSGGSVYADL